MKHVLKMSEPEVEKEREIIKQEIEQGLLPDPNKKDDEGGF